MSCDDAAKLYDDYMAKVLLTAAETADLHRALLRNVSCVSEKTKKRYIATETPSGVDVKEAPEERDQYIAACATAAGGVAASTGVGAVATGAVSAYAGKVSCPAAYDAIVDGDPTIILAPEVAQAK